MKKRIFSMILVICITFIMSSAAFAAGTYYEASDLASLQAALNSASQDDVIKIKKTIIVPAGETLTLDGNGAKLVPAEDFVSDGNNAVIVLAANATSFSASSNYTLKNLRFDGFENLTRIIRANAATTVIENCIFEKNELTASGDFNAVITSTDGKLTVNNCKFYGNVSTGMIINLDSDQAMSSGNTRSATISDNTFFANKAEISLIALFSSADVTGNLFEKNTCTGSGANASAVLAGPYTGSMAYEINITGNAFEKAMRKENGTPVPAVFAEDWSSYGATTEFDIGKNYWDGGMPVEGSDYAASGSNPNVALNGYYKEFGFNIDDGDLVLYNFISTETPETGDSARPMLWIVLCGIGLAGAVILRGKKRVNG